jgi:hypothetical protein
MKLPRHISRARRTAGILLTECLVYLAVFSILLGIGTAAFYFCWDHTRAVIFTANEVETALRAGEHWRADVRAATGKISVATTTDGATMTIPAGRKKIIYRFAAGELRREISPQNLSQAVLAKVKSSEMKAAGHDGVTAWQWELELTPRREEGHFPLLFTFEAAQSKP